MNAAAQYSPMRAHMATSQQQQQQTWAQGMPGGGREEPAGFGKGGVGAASGAGARQVLQSPGAGRALLQVPQKSPACSNRAPIKSPTNTLEVLQVSPPRSKEPC